MKLKSKRGIGLLGAIGTLVVAGYLTSTGFCFSQGRYLEDAEFFDRAIAYHAKSIRELAEIGRPAAAGDISEFRQHHSACCEVMGKDFPLANGFFNNLLGFKSTWIRIRYELSAHELERAPILRSVHRIVLVRPCVPLDWYAFKSTLVSSPHKRSDMRINERHRISLRSSGLHLLK